VSPGEGSHAKLRKESEEGVADVLRSHVKPIDARMSKPMNSPAVAFISWNSKHKNSKPWFPHLACNIDLRARLSETPSQLQGK